MRHQINSVLLFFFAGFINSVNAQDISYLPVDGDDTLPGIVGFYEPTSLFSWMHNIFPENTSGHSWTLEPGTDGGFSFGWAQSPGELTNFRAMYNVPTSFFSVNNGITVDEADNIDMSNLRMWRASVVTDVGAGSGYDTLVPRVASIQALSAETNGWVLNPDDTYHIIYHTRGTCVDCRLILHFYGANIMASGDINNDGKFGAADMLLSQRAYLGLISLNLEQLLHADIAPIINGEVQPDGEFDIQDVIAIQRKALGLTNY